jgi:hypothetical protein
LAAYADAEAGKERRMRNMHIEVRKVIILLLEN